MQNVQQPYLRTAGQERLDVDVGVMHLQVVVSKTPGDADSGQDPCLGEDQSEFSKRRLRSLPRCVCLRSGAGGCSRLISADFNPQVLQF